MKILNEKNDPNRPKGLKGASEGWSPDQVKEINKMILDLEKENKASAKQNAELLKLGKDRQAQREIDAIKKREIVIEKLRSKSQMDKTKRSLGDYLRKNS